MNYSPQKRADLQAEVLKDQSLKRVLGPGQPDGAGDGAIIERGVFVLTGQAAAKYAGRPSFTPSCWRASRAHLRPVLREFFPAMIPISGSPTPYVTRRS